MPVSRNRKKKTNQNNKYKCKDAFPANLSDLFSMNINDCRKCEGIRDEFAFDELPVEEQVHWDKSGILKQIDYILYCTDCEEYSAIVKLEEL